MLQYLYCRSNSRSRSSSSSSSYGGGGSSSSSGGGGGGFYTLQSITYIKAVGFQNCGGTQSAWTKPPPFSKLTDKFFLTKICQSGIQTYVVRMRNMLL